MGFCSNDFLPRKDPIVPVPIVSSPIITLTLIVLGLSVIESLVQSASNYRTGIPGDKRLTGRPGFHGPVTTLPGAKQHRRSDGESWITVNFLCGYLIFSALPIENGFLEFVEYSIPALL
jgi:hypothetical protein